MTIRVLVVDDEAPIREGMAALLDGDGVVVATAATLDEGLARAGTEPVDVLILDRRLPDGDGVERIPDFRRALGPDAAIVVATAFGETDTVVQAIRAGAASFLDKPADPEQLATLVEELGRPAHARRMLRSSRNRERHRALGALGGSSRAMAEFRKGLEAAAVSDATVLLTGESGAGKGLAARCLHELSSRSESPFVDVGCAGLSPTLLESELFGYERGAFTDARERKIGLAEAADGGTLFLDEIGETDPGVQAKLLKVLEEKRFRRLGGISEIPLDVRLVAATNRDLGAMVAAGRFRSDLLYRLKVVELEAPPLRSRPEDVRELAERFLLELGADRFDGFEPEALDALVAHRWPGNVRELRNTIERVAIFAKGPRVLAADLPASLAPREERGGPELPKVRMVPLSAVEDDHVRAVFTALDRNVKKTAEVLGVSRTTLYAKLKRLGLDRP